MVIQVLWRKRYRSGLGWEVSVRHPAWPVDRFQPSRKRTSDLAYSEHKGA